MIGDRGMGFAFCDIVNYLAFHIQKLSPGGDSRQLVAGFCIELAIFLSACITVIVPYAAQVKQHRMANCNVFSTPSRNENKKISYCN